MQHCCEINDSQVLASPAYRKVLWTALLLNALMFGVEIVGGIAASSTSLLADSLDFLGDATNYGISIFVLGMSLRVRARASLIKALTMALFGMFVLGKALYGFFVSVTPEPYTMGAIAILALLVNVLVALLLYRYRNGDSNMRSVWICSRNDALGNVAVMFAASGVLATHLAYPDLLVAVLMATLAIWGALQILEHARTEVKVEP